jgi:hypothetical protein
VGCLWLAANKSLPQCGDNPRAPPVGWFNAGLVRIAGVSGRNRPAVEGGGRHSAAEAREECTSPAVITVYGFKA